MAYYENVVSSVGSTPLIKLNRVTAGLPATIALKGEFNNILKCIAARQLRKSVEIPTGKWIS